MSSLVARLAVGAGLTLVRALPRSFGIALANAVGWLTWSLGIRRAVVLDNLRLAFPEVLQAQREVLARGAFNSAALAMYESITSDLLPAQTVAKLVEVTDWKGLDALLAARKPVLIASAHLGSWELFAEVMARRGFVFSAVVRPLKGAFNDWLVRSRTKAGVELILQRGALRNMLRALKQGRAVVQLIDQALPGRGAVWVPFFGRLASTTPAVSMAALRSGAPVYVVAATRSAGHLVMHVDGPIALEPPGEAERHHRDRITAHTAAITASLERMIRAHPEQWLWLHRRWKGTPPPSAPAAVSVGTGKGASSS